MFLNEFFKNAPCITINQLSCDSRVPMKDCIYFCVKGIKYNGHDFIDEAINNGANVIVYSDDIDVNKNAIFVKVNNVDDVLNQVSSKFYDNPSSKLETYVVSGTNGRSSVSSIIYDLLSPIKKCSSIGVFGINNGDSLLYSNQPTLTILDNQKYLDSFVKNGCRACVFEGKALSLSYKKLDMVNPNAFVYTFTNKEASDFIELGKNYIDSIKRYLYSLDNECKIVLNIDDYSFEELYKAAGDNKYSYGKNTNADYVIADIRCGSKLTTFSLKHGGNTYLIESPLIGEVNVYNLVAALATLNASGYTLDELISRVNSINYIEGVYDRLNFNDYNIIVDCAYTTISYSNILNYAKTITPSINNIILILSINSSDNLDRIEKLVEISESISSIIILTVDDTYEDDGHEALKLASSLIKDTKHLVIEDREGAIEEAIELMNKDDTLLILGKGSESYMYQGLVRKSYNGDKNIAYKYMNKRLKEESLED